MDNYLRTLQSIYVSLAVIILSGLVVTTDSYVESRSVLKPHTRGQINLQYLFRQKRNAPTILGSECIVNCTSTRRRPVCATDGRTYPSRCDVKRMRRCHKRDIDVLSKGNCRGHLPPGVAESTIPSKCFREREQALAHAESPPNSRSQSQPFPRAHPDQFIPICTPEGYFSEVQCLQTSGASYCWCVTADGKPIHGSSVQGSEISCHGQNARGSVSGCSPLDRSIFNANIIHLFSQEYGRIPSSSSSERSRDPSGVPIRSEPDSLLDTPEKRVIEWKFAELDVNGDGELRMKELRSLKRMVKVLVQPKSCAKNFDAYCDMNQNGLVTRMEWSVCLGVDINNERATTPQFPALDPGPGGIGSLYAAGDNPGDRHRSNSAGDISGGDVLLGGRYGGLQPAGEASPGAFPDSSSLHSSHLLRSEHQQSHGDSGTFSPQLLWSEPFNTEPAYDYELPVRSAHSPQGCDDERRYAEKMDREEPAGGTFIPLCADDGSYELEQCHKASGMVCWCVDRDSGTPIVGTTTRGTRPDCSPESIAQVQVTERATPRPISITSNTYKGCPSRKKVRFLSDVLDAISTELVALASNATLHRHMPELDPEHSFEERVARWKFYLLDTNRNENLERREWKAFKKEIRKLFKRKKSLRKCCRNFLSYCDSDSDNAITVEEWLTCVVVADDEFTELSTGGVRVGKNPFTKVLNQN